MGEDIKKGLQGVVVTESSISHIDGKKGKLIYRGYDISDLAKNSCYEEVVFLLWYKRLPTRKELATFRKKLRNQRDIDKSTYAIMKHGAKQTDSMDVLNTLTTYLGQTDPDLNNNDREANIRKGMHLTAQFPTIVANYWRIHEGKKPIKPRNDLCPGHNFLYILTGKVATNLQARAMEMDFLLTAEHGINASTFATMVATATMSDLHSAISAGIATLKGPLHGAARRKVYEMLPTIKSAKNAHPWLMEKIAKHERIMGFGHRVYKAFDPRAKVFKQIAKELADEAGDSRWYDISLALEEAVIQEFVKKKGKPIWPNVDFWTGAVYRYLGIPAQLTTGIFAVARIGGWTAHILEQNENNRLIRPAANYVGDKGLKYVPIGER